MQKMHGIAQRGDTPPGVQKPAKHARLEDMVLHDPAAIHNNTTLRAIFNA